MRRRHLDARRANTGDALGGVAHPAAAGDVIVETRVTVDENVNAGAVLGDDVASETIEMLFSIGVLRQTVGERHAA